MFNVTTKYEDVNGERKKVFMVRGDEAYARTTNVEVTVDESTITTSEVTQFTIPSTVINMYRNLGNTSVSLYDGEVLLGVYDVLNSSSTKSISNLKFTYNITHELWAVLKANDKCLGSKSKKLSLKVDAPTEYQTVMVIDDSATQIAEGDTFDVDVTATIDSDPIPDDTPVIFYIDEEYLGESVTDDGLASYTISADKLTKGKHTVTATINQSATVNYASESVEVCVGYSVEIVQYPTPYVYGQYATNTTKVRVLDYNNEPQTSGTVSLFGGTSSLDSDGIATFSTLPSASGNYHATYSGVDSPNIAMNLFKTIGWSISGLPTVVERSSPTTFTAHVVCESGYCNGEGATLNCNGVNYTLDSSNNCQPTLTYDTTGYKSINVKIGTINNTQQDIYLVADSYWSPSKRMNLNYHMTGGTGSCSITTTVIGVSLDSNDTIIKFDYTDVATSKTIELKMKCDSPNYLRFGYGSTFYQCSFVNDDVIKITYGDNKLGFSVNGGTVTYKNATESTTGAYWSIKSSATRKLQFQIKELKIY